MECAVAVAAATVLHPIVQDRRPSQLVVLAVGDSVHVCEHMSGLSLVASEDGNLSILPRCISEVACS